MININKLIEILKSKECVLSRINRNNIFDCTNELATYLALHEDEFVIPTHIELRPKEQI